MTKVIKLGEACEFLDSKRKPITKKDRIAGPYPYYGANGVQDYVNDYLFDDELVLLAEDGGHFDEPSRGVAYRVSGKCWVNNHAHVLKPKDNIDVDYLGYVLSQYDVRPFITGAVIKKLNQQDARRITIPLPSIDKQKEIVSLLDQADSLRQKRQQAIDMLDEYLKSVFLDMFGNLHINKKKWDYTNFGNFISVLTDYHANGSYKILREHVKLTQEPDFALMVRTTDLEHNNFTDDVNYIDQDAYEFLSKSKVFGGEIIINKIGSAGKVYLMPELNRPVSLGMNAFLLRFNEKLNNVFAYYLLTSEYGENIIQRKVKGAVTKTIRKDAIRNLQIPLIPEDLQSEFVDIVSKTQETKKKMQAQLIEMDNQFNALMQQFFSVKQ